jgi:hypothetical protein
MMESLLKFLAFCTTILAVVQARSTCLRYDDIVDTSIETLSVQAYQGVWYVASTNEPTEPKVCACDIFNWTLTSDSTFADPTTFTCADKVTSTMHITGTL